MTGTFLFTITAPDLLTRLLGLLLVAAVAWRRLEPRPPARFATSWFLLLGAGYGFLSGLTAAVASMLAPFFLAYGLRKGAYVGTIGLSVFLVQLAKLTVFGGTNFLKTPVLLNGLALMPFMILGTVLGKKLLERVSERVFVIIMEVVMVTAGLVFIARGAG